MAQQLVRTVVCRAAPRVAMTTRALTTSTARPSELTVEQRDKYYPKVGKSREGKSRVMIADKYYPKVGNRDIVGFGMNGTYSYLDRVDFPMPAIRFGENTPDVLALREKEKGDWKQLSIEDKKALYRASFCQTFAEMNAPTGEWKPILTGVLAVVIVTGWVMIWIKKYVYLELPHTITDEWKEAQTEQMIRQGQGRIEGISSKWDYDNNKWK